MLAAVTLVLQCWPSRLSASILLAAALPALLLLVPGLWSADHYRAVAKGVLFVPIVLSAPRLAAHLFSTPQALPPFAISCLKASGSWGLFVAGAIGLQLPPVTHVAVQVLAGFWAASHNSAVCAAVLSTQVMLSPSLPRGQDLHASCAHEAPATTQPRYAANLR